MKKLNFRISLFIFIKWVVFATNCILIMIDRVLLTLLPWMDIHRVSHVLENKELKRLSQLRSISALIITLGLFYWIIGVIYLIVLITYFIYKAGKKKIIPKTKMSMAEKKRLFKLSEVEN